MIEFGLVHCECVHLANLGLCQVWFGVVAFSVVWVVVRHYESVVVWARQQLYVFVSIDLLVFVGLCCVVERMVLWHWEIGRRAEVFG